MTTTTDAESAAETKASLKVLTPEFRVSFPSVFKPRINKQNPTADPKYEITMLFRVEADPTKPEEKVVDIRPLVFAAQSCAVAEWGPKEKWPKNLLFPFRKADDRTHLDGYVKGLITVKATGKQAPTVWNEFKKDIIDPKDFQPGYWAVAAIAPFAWKNTGKYGVSFGLRSIMKLRNGKVLGGGSNPDEDFAAIPLPSGAAAGASGGIEDMDLGIPGL